MKSRARHFTLNCQLAALVLGHSPALALIWDSNGSTAPNPNDGTGAWFENSNWWDGTQNVAWNPAVHSSAIAVFGSAGTAGVVTVGSSGVNVGGLEFRSLTNSVGYSIGDGVITIANGGLIDLYAGSSNAGTNDRLRFTSTSVLAGSNITITNANETTTATNSFVTLRGSNTWTGKLTLSSNETNTLFVNATNTNAFNSLSEIEVKTGVTLSLEASGMVLNIPKLTLSGNGSSGRGAIRIDQPTVISSDIVLTGSTHLATNASAGSVATIYGQITGNQALLFQNTNGDMGGRYVLASSQNSYGATTIHKGNLQIGLNGIGRTGNGLVTMDGPSAVVSGTGTTQGGFLVRNGTIRPGDDGGEKLGVLTIAGNLNLTGISAQRTAVEFSLGDPTGVSDRLNVTGGLLLNANSNLVAAFAATYSTPTLGDSWTLVRYDGALTQGAFDFDTNLILPDISASGYNWLVGAPASNGSLTVTIVPEPTSLVLSGLGAAMLVARRRRK
jgi:fibronectin-binding autotransporter adhesin